MSGSLGYPTTPLTDAERADVRRFCGYALYGPGSSGFVGYRFFQAYGLLEYRLTNMAPAELQVLRQYLTQVYALEAAIIGAAGNLDTDQAAVWFHNKNEVSDRTKLFDTWRRRMCSFLGIPPGSGLADTAGSIVI